MRTSLILLLSLACLWAQDKRPNGLYATFLTSKGSFTAKLFEKETPETVKNFVELALGRKPTIDPRTGAMVRRPLYNNITFHRVTPGEMIQAGDPTGTGRYNCGVKLKDEYMPGLRFIGGGKLAMANTGEPDSGGCQFFITVGPMTMWNEKYPIFGQVVEGQQVVDVINHQKVKGDKPIEPVRLVSVTIERVGPEPASKKKK